ncbi:MAG: hypothetical protein NTAFB05_25960 [Nitrobacter sp.]
MNKLRHIRRRVRNDILSPRSIMWARPQTAVINPLPITNRSGRRLAASKARGTARKEAKQ